MRGRGIVLGIGLALAIPATAQAVDYSPGDMNDAAPVAAHCDGVTVPDPDCSLRDAVAAAEASPAVIDRVFLGEGTWTLSGAANDDANQSGDLDVMTSATFPSTLEIGASFFAQNPVVIQAAPNDRIFDMRGGSISTFAVSNLTIENGNVVGTGGAIRAVGNGGNLVVGGSLIRNNAATVGGGAIDFTGLAGAAGARLALAGATITGNDLGTAGQGGGVRSNRETDVAGSTISGNGTAGTTPALGGGLMLHGPNTATDRSTIVSSSVHGNRALTGGGVGVINGHRLTIANSTIGANTSNNGAVAVGESPSSVFFESATVANNIGVSATATDAASIHRYAGAVAADLTARNTIIATNDPNNDNCGTFPPGGSALTSLGTNIQFGRPGDPSCAVAPQASDRTVDPLLPAGGATTIFGQLYFLPSTGSPAIDTGSDCELHTGMTTDQLSEPRTQGAACDVGSVEQARPAAATATPTTPCSGFQIDGISGRRLKLTLDCTGAVEVANGGGKKLLKPSSAAGGPGALDVPVRLTKAAKRKLREKGKVRVAARITFTPTGGTAQTETARLKVRKKK